MSVLQPPICHIRMPFAGARGSQANSRLPPGCLGTPGIQGTWITRDIFHGSSRPGMYARAALKPGDGSVNR